MGMDASKHSLLSIKAALDAAAATAATHKSSASPASRFLTVACHYSAIPVATMSRLKRLLVPCLLLAWCFHIVDGQNCNTNLNPYCANEVFQQLCCPYPNRCFYANRYGAVGCCPYGQDCQGSSNPPPITVTAALGPSTSTTIIGTITITQSGSFQTVSGVLVGDGGRLALPKLFPVAACVLTLLWCGG